MAKRRPSAMTGVPAPWALSGPAVIRAAEGEVGGEGLLRGRNTVLIGTTPVQPTGGGVDRPTLRQPVIVRRREARRGVKLMSVGGIWLVSRERPEPGGIKDRERKKWVGFGAGAIPAIAKRSFRAQTRERARGCSAAKIFSWAAACIRALVTQREGEEAVVGVFGVDVIVGPVAVKSALGGPERVDEVHATFVQRTRDAGGRARRERGVRWLSKADGQRRGWHGTKAACGCS